MAFKVAGTTKAGAPLAFRSMMADVFTLGGASTPPGSVDGGNVTVTASFDVKLNVGTGTFETVIAN
jgi:hypothetical protein